jgi:lysophospholipid acyltransferase (LPLAT)-like uncharacterized protein
MPRPFDALRRRAERSPLLAQTSGAAMAGWTRFCHATSRWDVRGAEEVTAATAEGPVLMLLWHEMVMLGSAHWQAGWGRLVTLHDGSPAGRSAAAAQARMGATPFVVTPGRSNPAVTRDILGLIRAGASLAVTGDGPRGPCRVLKDPALDWARAAGVPVFVYGWAITGMPRAKSWDRMQLARPFARGAVVFRRWEGQVPRRLDEARREALRADLAAHLTAVAEEARALVAPRGG